MGWQEFVGYVGSFLLFSTFWMRTMIPLRVAAICGNIAMATYAAMAGFYPMVALQVLALPVNVARLWQMRRMIRRVALASGGEFTAGSLVPFMKREVRLDGDVLFRAGDQADRMYLIREGHVQLVEVDHLLGPDDLFGEIGVMSAQSRRTATAVCKGRTVLMTIDQEHVLQLYFQEPEFGFYLMRLVTDRLLSNIESSRATG